MKVIILTKTTAAIVFLFICFFQINGLTEYKINIIKNPKPTSEEKLFTELVKSGEVSLRIEDENFLVLPYELAVTKEGSIFVFDSNQKFFFIIKI